MVKAFERLGFVKIRQSGSHVIMRRGSSGGDLPRTSVMGSCGGQGEALGIKAENARQLKHFFREDQPWNSLLFLHLPKRAGTLR